ncbi:MAG: sulfotransferase [Candidatus Limnocylindrales bacterium]
MTTAPASDDPSESKHPKPAWPSGESPGDPRPTPIRITNLWRWAHLTWRAERRYYRRLERPRGTGRATRLVRSLWPSVERPVFLIGAARSGTTFLGDCVGRLPEISYHHEPPATKAAGRYAYEGGWGFRRSRWFFRLVYRWLLRVELDGGLRFTEKTPTNALLIPFLDRSFKGAQFVHIVRDGRDVATSHVKKPWLLASSRGSTVREPGGYLHGPYAPWWVEPDRRAEFEATSDIHRVIWAWRRYVEAALRDGPALGPGHYLEVRFESLIANTQHEGERILDFLGITAVDSRATFHQALGRAEPGTVGGWRRELSAEDLATIDADSGDLLRSLRYALDADPTQEIHVSQSPVGS